MRNQPWTEQYERMKRYYKRFEQINNGINHSKDSDYYKDEVYSFFTYCYHLKDWIKNDPGLNIQNVEEFIHSKEILKICGDISNGVKHLNLNNPKVGNGAKIEGANFFLNLGSKDQLIKVQYYIEADGYIYDAFDLATEAIQLWDEFLTENNIDSQ